MTAGVMMIIRTDDYGIFNYVISTSEVLVHRSVRDDNVGYFIIIYLYAIHE